ncbi:MAG: hypothetical protein HC904_05685 [Blastochloris sp.]|nr:hypothetical protein [Blastochloris sp.]
MENEKSVVARCWMGPSLAGLLLGGLVGLSPLAESEVLEAKAIWTLGAGLALTYLSVGVLVGVLPGFAWTDRNRWGGFLFGLLVGTAYSLPGAFFTMVPYPLAEDAAAYWREFADGGWRAFGLTLGFGGVVGGLCGLCRRSFKRNLTS